MTAHRNSKNLSRRRDEIEAERDEFIATGAVLEDKDIPQEILSFWQ